MSDSVNTVLIVEASSVADYLSRYYKSERRTPTLLSSYTKDFERDGYICTSGHDNITGRFIAWPFYPVDGPMSDSREELIQRICESVETETEDEDIIVCSQQTTDQIEAVQNPEKLREYHRKYSRGQTSNRKIKDKSAPAVDFGEL